MTGQRGAGRVALYSEAEAVAEVLKRLGEARQLHPTWPKDIIHQTAIMVEEAGESIQAAINAVYHDGSRHDLNWEVMQTAAMCLRILTEHTITAARPSAKGKERK
jgi:hypothetical protein